MSARAPLNNGCSSPQKDGCSRPLKIMGAPPHFFNRAFHELYFFHVHCVHSSVFHLVVLQIMSAHALLNNGCSSPQKDGCSSPQKDGCSRPLKIMGARPHFFKRALHEIYFFHDPFYIHLCSFSCFLISCASHFYPCTYLIVLSIVN